VPLTQSSIHDRIEGHKGRIVTMNDIIIEKRQDLVQQVGDIKAACVAMSWALETAVDNGLSPSAGSESFEVYSGMSYILKIIAKDLGSVYGQLCDQ
jgi:hypothetical protein